MLHERVVPLSSGLSLFVVSTAQRSAEPLVVVHGGPDWDHSYLREPLVDLCECHTVIFVDLRGCGHSTQGLAPHQCTPDLAVSDLLALVDALGIGTFSLLGFSYGGFLAQRLAVTAHQRVKRLIVASSSVVSPGEASFGVWPERERRLAVESKVWTESSLSGPQLTRAAAIAGAQADVWRDDLRTRYLKRLDQVHFSADWLAAWTSGILPSARLDDATTRLSRTEIPMLLLHGERDMRFPADGAARAAARMANAQATTIADAGHMTHVDQPQAWLQAVRSFLHHP